MRSMKTNRGRTQRKACDCPYVKASILLVDDDSNTLAGYRQLLTEDGFQVTVASSGIEALRLLQGQAFDLIIADWHMPVMDGIQLLVAVRRLYPMTPFLMVTAYGDSIGRAAIDHGAEACLTKPFPYALLAEKIAEILHRLPAAPAVGR
ncbi:MAG: response regulator [Planctomycetes bacterium]|nr:response regulator [Planctomycetota bacterium]